MKSLGDVPLKTTTIKPTAFGTEWRRGEFLISDDIELLKQDEVRALYSQTDWANDYSEEKIRRLIKTSFWLGLYKGNKLIGLVRGLTDRLTSSWIYDVVVDETFRKRGLGTWMMRSLLEHPAMKGTSMGLGTQGKDKFFERFEFERASVMVRCWRPPDRPNQLKPDLIAQPLNIPPGGTVKASDVRKALKAADSTLKGSALTIKVNDVLTGKNTVARAVAQVTNERVQLLGSAPDYDYSSPSLAQSPQKILTFSPAPELGGESLPTNRKTKLSFLLLSKQHVSIKSAVCDECMKLRPWLGRYRSDKGNVNVCIDCKKEVFARSFDGHSSSIKGFTGGGTGVAGKRR